jgi:hypothetical protein
MVRAPLLFRRMPMRTFPWLYLVRPGTGFDRSCFLQTEALGQKYPGAGLPTMQSSLLYSLSHQASQNDFSNELPNTIRLEHIDIQVSKRTSCA